MGTTSGWTSSPCACRPSCGTDWLASSSADRSPRPVILVDDAIWPWRGRRWAHLVSDESYDELHQFAARLGIPVRAFQGDHYDVPESVREQAISLGATAVGS